MGLRSRSRKSENTIGVAPLRDPASLTVSAKREALEAGSRTGYYDVPRTGSIEDVASELDCAASTASNHLRKAESRLVGEVIEG